MLKKRYKTLEILGLLMVFGEVGALAQEPGGEMGVKGEKQHVFAYREDVLKLGCGTSVGIGQVRGYAVQFVKEGLSLHMIHGDGTVSGVLWMVDGSCLSDLDERQHPYVRQQIHVESLERGQNPREVEDKTIPAWSYMVPHSQKKARHRYNHGDCGWRGPLGGDPRRLS